MLSAAKKRRVTSSNSSFNSDDDGNPPAIRDITANVSVSENNKSDFRVMYIVSFTKPCCDNHIKGKRVRIQICSETAFFWDGADTCSLMKEKTIKAIRSHKISKKFDGIHLCNLDYGIGIGSVYMASNHPSESLWKLVYLSAENNMNKLLLKRHASRMTQTNQHEAKADALMHANWEKGDDFMTKQLKSRACQKVEHTLCLMSKKSTVKATIILLEMVSKLSHLEYFNENEILTNDQRDMNTTMHEMLNHASACIKVTNVNRRTTQQQQLLTGIAAAFIPPSTSISLRKSCDLLGMNRQAIYVARGMQFWLEHDAYMKLMGAIKPGKSVDIRDG
jgi:hypothetical protein